MGIRTLGLRTATTVGTLLPAGIRRVPAFARDASEPRVPADTVRFRSSSELARAVEEAGATEGSRAAARP